VGLQIYPGPDFLSFRLNEKLKPGQSRFRLQLHIYKIDFVFNMLYAAHQFWHFYIFYGRNFIFHKYFSFGIRGLGQTSAAAFTHLTHLF